MATAQHAPTREDFAKLLDESFGGGNLQEGSVIKGNDRRHREGHGRHRRRPEDRRPRGAARIRRARAGRTNSRSATRSKSIWSASRTRSAKRCCRATRRGARKAGASSRPRSRTTRRSPASSSTRSRAASPSISTAPWPSCRARQVDIRPIRDVTPLMNVNQPFQILKMDRRRGNIVVSRRTVLEETRAEQRQELVQNLEEGQVIDGVVKNITDYGAFVDLGGIDGLLHVTDIAWRRVNHPTEVLNIGQQVKVKIIKINHETHRISLGMKQLLDDPWQGIEAKFPVGTQLQGPRHQHHRLRRLRRAGAGHRGPDPRLRNVVDQEERASRQDRLDLAGSRSADPRSRSGQAPHLARPQADHAQSVGGLRREVSAGLDGRRRGQEQDRVRPVPRPRRRRRRHGPPLRPRLEASGRAGDRGIQEGRHGQGAGARRRCREGAHLARHQAARRRPDGARPATSRRARWSPARSPRSRRPAST